MLAACLHVVPYPFLRSGQKIRVEHGPLADVEGGIVAVKNGFRLVASVTMLQRSFPWRSTASGYPRRRLPSDSGSSMPETLRKNRTISIRLSEREFQALRALHSVHGARSISEFIRATMHSVIGESSHETDALERRVQEMDEKLTILDGELARLARLLENRHEPE